MKYSWLPHVYREIATYAGLDAALALAEAHGGTRVYIPVKAKPGNWLVDLLGPASARVVCDLFGSSYVTLPTNPNGGLKAMQRRAEQALDEGLSANEAARRSGLHVRRIYARRAARRERGDDLFSIAPDQD